MAYWLMKSEPDVFGYDDLVKHKREGWDGIRNYQARNYLRDDVRAGDGVLFYHAQSDKAVVGLARIAKGAHPDPTQFERKHHGFDPGSDPKEPRWFAVDLAWEADFETPVTLDAIKKTPGLAGMVLVTKGSRLSVQPVTAEEWKIVVARGRAR